MARAPILLFGATGFTGRLITAALVRRGLSFAVAGRSRERLDALAYDLGGVEAAVVDLASAESIRAALSGRVVVSSCVGPFLDLGEPMLASAARAGVHYADTTGEQPFVHLAVSRYRATAEASGACVVPAMAYEIAPADWAAHEAAARVGGAPDAIDIVYVLRPKGGYVDLTTRGTKLSLLRMLADRSARQYIDGALRPEAPARYVRRFRAYGGHEVTAFSFPSPEAIVVPGHTGAKNVRTFLAAGASVSHALLATRGALPRLARMASGALARMVAHTAEGPTGEAREATFEILVEARRGSETVRVVLRGRDPYGLTAEIQALMAERAVRGELRARGVVAPSQAIPPLEAISALAAAGLTIAEE